MSQLGIENLGELRAPPPCGFDELDTTTGEAIHGRQRPRFAYPRHYVWVLTLALMDVVLTWLVLGTGGQELNTIARFAIEHGGVFGMIGIKAATLAVIISICEYIGRRRPLVGRRIVEFALAANSVAVACGLVYLTQFGLVILQIV